MRKDNSVAKFITEYVKANHIMEVNSLKDSVEVINIVFPDKTNKPYDFTIGNKINNIQFEKGQYIHKVLENGIATFGASQYPKLVDILKDKLHKLEASTKNLKELSIYDLVRPGEDFYIAESTTIKNKRCICMGRCQDAEDMLKILSSTGDLLNYTFCGCADRYIVLRLLKTFHAKEDIQIYADIPNKRFSISLSDIIYNFILDENDSAIYELVAQALYYDLQIKPFYKGGTSCE